MNVRKRMQIGPGSTSWAMSHGFCCNLSANVTLRYQVCLMNCHDVSQHVYYPPGRCVDATPHEKHFDLSERANE